MSVGQLEITNVTKNTYGNFANSRRAADPREVLEEVFELLEDYGPIFYTEELHNRIVAALMPREI